MAVAFQQCYRRPALDTCGAGAQPFGAATGSRILVLAVRDNITRSATTWIPGRTVHTIALICWDHVTIVFRDAVLFSHAESMVFLATQRSVYLQKRGEVAHATRYQERSIDPVLGDLALALRRRTFLPVYN